MPRAEVGTPKYLANKMKAKGLQKLRWYCQMCQKQCRDENGFKCHTSSESHQRQLLLFADNPGKYLGSFSQEFEDGMLDLLRRQYSTKRVQANVVYQEYIRDRNHIHMNATRWHSLTGFVMSMGKQGKCVVDETEKGWYIQYVDRRPETILRQKELERKEKHAKDNEERMMEFFDRQVELGKMKSSDDKPVYTELKRENPEEKISLNLQFKSKSSSAGTAKNNSENTDKPTDATKAEIFKSQEVFKKPSNKPQLARKVDQKPEKRKASALEEIIKEQEYRKERANRKENWITENIVVKVMAKSLGDKYYKQKGVIKRLENKFVGIVKMLESGHTLKLDQEHLETVIPAVGRKVKLVNGAYRGNTAVLKRVLEKEFCVTLQIDEGPLHGRILENVGYDDVSKVFVPPT